MQLTLTRNKQIDRTEYSYTALFKLFYVVAHLSILNLTAAHILYEIENQPFVNLATRATYLKRSTSLNTK